MEQHPVVSPDAAQGVLPVFTPLELLRVRQDEADRLKRLIASRAKALRYAGRYPKKFRFDNRTIDFLDNPIVLDGLQKVTPSHVELDNRPQADVPQIPWNGEWTDDEIVQLHCILLEESLGALRAKGNAKDKKDILNWIFFPEVPDFRPVKCGNVNRMVFTPFSLTACCKFTGFDADRLRDALYNELSELGLEFDF